MGKLEVGHGRVRRGCCKKNTAFRRERKREKVAVGPGSRECNAGYETKKCGELRVRCRELCALRERGKNMSVSRLVLQK